MCREVFGPVVVLRPFDSFYAANDEADDTPYGLAAGVFTSDLDRAISAAQPAPRRTMQSTRRRAAGSTRINIGRSDR